MKPVNLNQVRKDRSRAESKAQADANAVRFGRTKAQKMKEAAQTTVAKRNLDQARFEE